MDSSGNLYWDSAGDNNANGPYPFQNYWTSDNHTVPVVAGQWFHLETFTHRSTGSDGEFWAKVDGQTIVDHMGSNIGVNNDPINRIMVSENYSNGHMPASQWVDDVQIWDGIPPSGATPSPTPTPTPIPAPAGSQSIVLHVSETAWQGDAQFTVMADGQQVGGVQTATASHAAGQWQDITLTGDFGANGPSQVDVNYINDASGGTVSTDRNLYVQGIEVNGHHFDGTSATNTASLGYTDPNAADMLTDGTLTFNTAGSAPASTPMPSPTPTPTPTPAPAGSQSIVLHVSETAWQGDAQFTVMADGHQVGGVQTATASHTAGQWQAVTLTGDFGANGPSQIQVNYINDASGGTVNTDRNLYVQGIEVNGHHFDGTSATNTASLGYTDPNAADMLTDGTLTFNTAGSAPVAMNTIQVSSGAIVSGTAGPDLFVFSTVGKGSTITNFQTGQDLLDLRTLMKTAGYAGTDPVADHTIALVSDKHGGTEVTVDPTHSGTMHNLVDVQHVASSSLHVGIDLLWH
jgi:hypothetical protein